MELAIPFLALSGLYIVSNQKTKKNEEKNNPNNDNNNNQQENFENMGARANYLPNVDEIPQNYPVINTNQLVNTVQNYHVKQIIICFHYLYKPLMNRLGKRGQKNKNNK